MHAAESTRIAPHQAGQRFSCPRDFPCKVSMRLGHAARLGLNEQLSAHAQLYDQHTTIVNLQCQLLAVSVQALDARAM